MEISRRILLIVVTVLCISLSWIFVAPLFEFPDEQAHIESVEFLAAHGRMPAGDEWDMSAEMQRAQTSLGVFRDSQGNNKVTYHPEYRPEFTQSLVGQDEALIKVANTPENRNTYVTKEAARYPRLYYDYVGLWYRLVGQKDIFVRTYVERLGNSMLGVVVALTIYFLGMVIFRKQSGALVLTLLVMLQPMYTFLSAGINSDNLHNLLVTLVITLGVYQLSKRVTWWNLLLAAALVFLDLKTKPQGFIVIVLAALPILPWLLKQKYTRTTQALLVLYGVNLIIYTHAIWSPYIGLAIGSPNYRDASFIEFMRFSLNKLVAQNIVWYWGVFKWLGVVLPPLYWQIANRIVVLGGIGLMVYAWRALRRERLIVAPPVVAYLIATVVIYTLAIYYFDWQYVKSVGYSIGVQARYLFPTISAQMALLMIGLLSFSARTRYRQWVLIGLSLFIVWMQIGGIWRLATSYYDISSLQTFITQASQYKPLLAKGQWWYLWIGLYFGSILALLGAVLVQIRRDAQTETPTSKRT